MATKEPPHGQMHPIKALFLVAVQGVSVAQLLPKTKEKPWSNTFRDFMTSCFQVDPAARPSSTELLQHPFLKIGKRADLFSVINACTMITGL